MAPKLLSPDAPVSGVHEELREAERRGKFMQGSGLLPHTDGYVYGDYMPDFVFLLCEWPAAAGGANVLIDGKAVMESLAKGDVQTQQLAKWLQTTSVDLAENEDTGLVNGRPAEGPIVQRHIGASGRERLKWRRQINNQEAQKLPNWKPLSVSGQGDRLNVTANASEPPAPPSECSERYQSLWRLLKPGVGDEENLRMFDILLQRIGDAGFQDNSFYLARGDALVIDNYRFLHARAPYWHGDRSAGKPDGERASSLRKAIERRFWRVWSWTSEGSGLPPDGARTSQPIDDDVFGNAVSGSAKSRARSHPGSEL